MFLLKEDELCQVYERNEAKDEESNVHWQQSKELKAGRWLLSVSFCFSTGRVVNLQAMERQREVRDTAKRIQTKRASKGLSRAIENVI